MVERGRIGLTGAAGRIGSMLRRGLGRDWEIVSMTHQPADFESSVVDLADPGQVEGLFTGLKAVIHLAGASSTSASWPDVLHANISATHNVLVEAVRAKVERVVFASTNHVMLGHVASSPSRLDPDRAVGRRLRLDDPPCPDSLYGVSKLCGEALGRYFHQRHGLGFIGLRIGWTYPGIDPGSVQGEARELMRALFLSEADCLRLFQGALSCPPGFVLAFGVSRNSRGIFDLEETARVLGYHPEDDAEAWLGSRA